MGIPSRTHVVEWLCVRVCHLFAYGAELLTMSFGLANSVRQTTQSFVLFSFSS